MSFYNILLVCLFPDIDECLLGKDGCDPSAECANKPGNYTCTCYAGFEGNGTYCKGMLIKTLKISFDIFGSVNHCQMSTVLSVLADYSIHV